MVRASEAWGSTAHGASKTASSPFPTSPPRASTPAEEALPATIKCHCAEGDRAEAAPQGEGGGSPTGNTGSGGGGGGGGGFGIANGGNGGAGGNGSGGRIGIIWILQG